MRNAFFSELDKLMDVNDKVIFLTADLGFKLFDEIAKKHPSRVINVGIREEAMIGVAAGLSKEGFLPFVYSFVPFITLRSMEQIRVDLCYNNLFTAIVGLGSGLAYGPNGPTHMGIEDIAIMSALPNMTVLSPCDSLEVSALMPQIVKLESPVYIRLSRSGEPSCHKDYDAPPPRLYRPSVIKEGSDAIIFSYGAMVHDVLVAVREFEKENAGSVGLISCHTLKPLKSEMILKLVKKDIPIIVVEEHVSSGGLGSQLALLFEENSIKNPFYHLHLPDEYPNICGDRNYLLGQNSLSKEHIKRSIARILNKEK